MYQELSAKVDKVIFNVVKNITMALYSNCNDKNAWNPQNVRKYQECTNQISESSFEIKKNVWHIEVFSGIHNGEMSIQTKLRRSLGDKEIKPIATKDLQHAIAYIKNVSLPSNYSLSCFEIEGCLERKREVVITLKMIEWGIFGLESTGAGLFLAYHHSLMGPYFGDIDGNEWPHIPLHKEPTSLERNFNQLLTNITFEMSNQTLQNISLLDLPAFGSTIGTLKKGLKKQFIWPIKMNFALIETNQVINTNNIFMSYKTLTEDWAKYMDQLYNKDSANYFTSEMETNKYLNFARFIKADMKTFLIATLGNASALDMFLHEVKS